MALLVMMNSEFARRPVDRSDAATKPGHLKLRLRLSTTRSPLKVLRGIGGQR